MCLAFFPPKASAKAYHTLYLAPRDSVLYFLLLLLTCARRVIHEQREVRSHGEKGFRAAPLDSFVRPSM